MEGGLREEIRLLNLDLGEAKEEVEALKKAKESLKEVLSRSRGLLVSRLMWRLPHYARAAWRWRRRSNNCVQSWEGRMRRAGRRWTD